MKLERTVTLYLTEDEITALHEVKVLFEKLAAEMHQANIAEIGYADLADIEFATETVEDVLDACQSSGDEF